jgi:transcriptional regulator with XRE-family HTH domain
MPAQAPLIADALLTALRALGAGLRAQRERLRISAVVAAESAGMSRTTWHRIETGEPSVTMGAYLSAASALGLVLDLKDPTLAQPAQKHSALGPVRLERYPQLRRLAWQQPGTTELSAQEALALYERNWRHLDPATLEPEEQDLITALVKSVGGGRPLV